VIATASQLSAAIVLLPAIPVALPNATPNPTILISVIRTIIASVGTFSWNGLAWASSGLCRCESCRWGNGYDTGCGDALGDHSSRVWTCPRDLWQCPATGNADHPGTTGCIEALRSLSWTHAVWAIVGSIAVLGVGIGVFYHGLRRYESGNLMDMRG
jgi:hypothetical protein